MFNRSEVIVLTDKLTNKHMPLKTFSLLHYATPVGKYFNNYILLWGTYIADSEMEFWHVLRYVYK